MKIRILILTIFFNLFFGCSDRPSDTQVKEAVRKNFIHIFATSMMSEHPCGMQLYAKRKAKLDKVEILKKGQNEAYEVKGYITCTTYYSNSTKVKKLERFARIKIYKNDFGEYYAKVIRNN